MLMNKECKMKKLIGTIWGIAVFSLLLISCDFLVTVDFNYDAFVVQRDLWETTQPQNYQYHLDDWNDGYSVSVHTLIKVENGQFKEQVPDPDYPNYDEEYGLQSPLYTISGIYSSIEKEYKYYDNLKVSTNDDYLTSIEIEYDEVHHIPLKITKHYHVPAGLMDAPSKSITEIKNFEIIN
jgi:hypothetical protein